MHVLEVGLVSFLGRGALPVRERIGQHVLNQGSLLGVDSKQVVGGTVVELVPAVGGANLDGLVEVVGHQADVSVKLGASHVTTVKGLGSDGDGLDIFLVAGHSLLEGCEILLERGIIGAVLRLVLGAHPTNTGSANLSS